MQTAGVFALGTVASYEGIAALIRHGRRTTLYEAAFRKARDTGRTFVVVGDPNAGAHTSMIAAYGCGDVCVDLNSCPLCPNAIRADITAGPVPGILDDSAVVFVSCVLEYVDPFDAAWDEIMRMAGSLDNVFVVTVQTWTLTAELYPGAKQVLIPTYDQGSGNPSFKPEPVTTFGKVTAAGIIVGLLVWAFWPAGGK